MTGGTKKRLVWAVVVLLLLLGVVAVVAHHVGADRQMGRVEAEYLTQAQLDRLIADQRLIAEAGIFPVPTRERDAGEILNPFIKLDGGTVEQQTAVSSPWWASKEIFQQTKGPRGKDRPKAAERPWLLQPDTMPEGDLSIMRELMAYDHWETSTAGGRYAEYLATLEHPFLASSPIPNLVALQTLARLRLSRGLKGTDGAEMLRALGEVRHLAMLTHSTENLVASMVANALLSIEKRGYLHAVKLGLIMGEEWVPASDALRDANRRVGFGMVMVAMGWTVPDDAMEQVMAAGVPLFNLCGSLSEGVFQWHMLYPVWKGLPLERELSHMGVRLQANLDAAPQCRLGVARGVMVQPERMNIVEWREGMKAMKKPSEDRDFGIDLLSTPYVRIHALLGLMDQVGAVRMWRKYGETAADDWQRSKVMQR